MNEYLADLGVSYIKTHNLHWNVTGTQFKAVHEYLETLYDSYADVLDETAELLRMHDEMPAASLREYLDLSEIKELSSEEIKVKDTLKIVLDDMKTMKRKAEEVRTLAAEDDVYDVVASMEDQLGNYSKNIWFISSMLK